MRIRIMDFKKSFCWRSNLSNDDIIYTYVGLKTGVEFRGQVLKTGVESDIFWSERGSAGHTPTKDYPPPPPREKQYVFSILSPYNQRWNANLRAKGMKWVALPFVVLYRRNRQLNCITWAFLSLVCKVAYFTFSARFKYL